MTTTEAIVLAIVILAGLAALFVTTNWRRERESVDSVMAEAQEEKSNAGREVELQARQEMEVTKDKEVAEWTPPTPEQIGVSRRQFFNRSIVTLFGLGLASFGGACLAFLWPNKVTGFGQKVNAGKLSDIVTQITTTKDPFYNALGRFYINPYPLTALGKAANVASYKGPVYSGMEMGIVALYQKCVHLGCKVPWCHSSQWFECPCHGSRYNRVGEKKGGPAPRGLDRFGITVSGGNVVVDTGTVFLGPPVGTNTTGQEAEGPHC